MNLLSLLVLSLLCIEINGAVNYYKVLGVGEKATDIEIKKSYRELAKIWHPDKRKDDPRAQEKFIEISEAYSTLSDATKRRAYDLSRSDSSLGFGHGRKRSGAGHNRYQFQHGHGFRQGREFPRGHQFHYEFSSSSQHFTMEPDMPRVFVYLAWFVNFFVLYIPLMCICFPILTVFGVWRCCCGSAGENRSSTEAQRLLPDISRTTLQQERRVIIIALTDLSAKVLSEQRIRFSRDPVYLCRSSTVSARDTPPLSLVAFHKKGSRYCNLESSEASGLVVSRWIEKILNGEVSWSDAVDMPRSLKRRTGVL